MMTVGEQRHMAIVEAQLRRIADALEKTVVCLDAIGMTKVYNNPSLYDKMKSIAQTGRSEE